MRTKDVSAELEQAMQTIHEMGKQPTVALVKAQLTTSIPMPAIIAAIKNWKGNKQVPKIEVAASGEKNDRERIEQLEKQVAELTQRINALEEKK